VDLYCVTRVVDELPWRGDLMCEFDGVCCG